MLSLDQTLLAQDTHYWTQQFGTRSALMGGAVVAGPPDNSTVFYNPGGLGFLDETTISVNANLYRIENIRIENALGQQADFRSNQIGAVPILVSGMFNIKNPNWKVGYGLIAPVDFSFQGNARLDGMFPVVDDEESPGDEVLVGESEKISRFTEVTAILGLGRRLNERWSVGLSNLITLHNRSYRRQLMAHVVLNDAARTPMNTVLLQYTKYNHLRYAAKLGISYRGSRWSAGLTVTSPSVGLLGSGTVAADVTVQNLKYEEERVNGFGNDRQEKIQTEVKAPFNVALGLEHLFARSLVAFSVQYFGEIQPYDVIRADPGTFVRYGGIGNDLGSEDLLVVLGANRPVLNAAIGYERPLNEQLTLNLGFRNDMSYLDRSIENERGFKPTISSWDIYHLTGGITIQRARSSMSLGLLVSTGITARHPESGGIGNPGEDDLLFGVTTITSANYSSIGFLLGYTFNFKKFE